MDSRNIQELRETEFRMLREQMSDNLDRTAFFPVDLLGSDPEVHREEAYSQFLQKCRWDEASLSPVQDVPNQPPTPVTEAVIYTDKRGRKSVWAACHNRQHKLAYQKFWWTEGGLPKLEWLPGNRLHVDHSFNKARLLARSQTTRTGALEDGDFTELVEADVNVGYIRLFAVPADVNTGWGKEIEAPMSALAGYGGHFRGASWVILAKLTRIFPPRSNYDVIIASQALFGVFGLCGFKDIESLTRAFYSGLGFNHDLHLIQQLTSKGVANCFLDRTLVENDPTVRSAVQRSLTLRETYPLFQSAV